MTNQKSLETKIRSAARQAGISLRGNRDDIQHWGGYSYDPYRCVAATMDDDSEVEVWELEGLLGNFLPTDCAYVVMTRDMTAKETIDRLACKLMGEDYQPQYFQE